MPPLLIKLSLLGLKAKNNMKTPTSSNFLDFLKGLDYKKQAMYELLPNDKKLIVQSFSKDKQRKRALVMFSHEQHGVNARDKWVNGLHHMREQARDSNHFFNLLLNRDRASVDDFVDLYLDFEAGEHDSQKNTDPAVYSALSEGVKSFKARGYHQMDYDGLLNYFEQNPHKNPLNKKNIEPSSSIVSKTVKVEDGRVSNTQDGEDTSDLMLTKMGQHLKARRLEKNITQAQLAETCQISERTVKKIEKGEPSSTATLLKLFDYFDLSEKVLEATKPHDEALQTTKQRVRHSKGS